MSTLPPLPAKFAYTVEEFQQLGGPCPVKTYELAKAGKLALTKQGRNTRILHSEIERYFANLPAFTDETKCKVAPANRARRRGDA